MFNKYKKLEQMIEALEFDRKSIWREQNQLRQMIHALAKKLNVEFNFTNGIEVNKIKNLKKQ